MYPPVPFPTELIDLMFSFVTLPNHQTFSACNLVCHQWYLCSRPYMFRSITFKPVEETRNTADSFWNLLQTQILHGTGCGNGGSLTNLVKSLTLVVNPPPTEYGVLSVPRILPLLTGLTSLTISGYARLADIPSPIASCLSVTMSRIQRIELVSLEFKSDVFEVFDLFCHPRLHFAQAENPAPAQHSLTNGCNPVPLRELVLFNILPFSYMPQYDPQIVPMFSATAADLHSLSLTLNPMVMRSALTALLQCYTPVRFAQIQRLTLHTNSFNTQQIRDVLLQTPELVYFGYSPGFLKPAVNNYLPFQTSPSRGIPHVALASTVMGEPPLQANEIMRWWITELSHPSRAFVGVKTLELDIEGISFDSTDALWADLDQALSNNVFSASEGAGGMLETISITVPRVAANAVRRLFPRTNERGVLSV